MKLQLTKAEKQFVEGLFNPVVFFNIFIPEFERKVKLSRDYQDKVLLDIDKNIVIKAGRKVGKTTILESDILQTILLNPNKSALITTPNKAHIDPLFNRIINFLNSNKLFKSMIKRCIRSPEYMIEFSNGFVLYGRIAGTSKGTGLLSLHIDFLYVDEAQLYIGQALDQLQGCMNTGCRVRIFGVPNGLRNSYLSKAFEYKEFCKYVISRLQDPTFTEKERNRLITVYGGENSIAYRNQVLAEDNIAQQSTFNPKYFTKCFIDISEYDIVQIDGTRTKENEIEESELELPAIPEETPEARERRERVRAQVIRDNAKFARVVRSEDEDKD